MSVPHIPNDARTAAVEWYDELEAFAVTDYGLILEVLRQPEAFSSRSAPAWPLTVRSSR